jgi:membrane associated rhomboid family serine protease
MQLLPYPYQTILVSAAGGFIAGALGRLFAIAFDPNKNKTDWQKKMLSIGRNGVIWSLMFSLSVFPLFSDDAIGLLRMGIWLAFCSFFIELGESILFPESKPNKELDNS